MKQIKIINYIVLIGLVLTAASCQKVININLNSSAPQYVVEGNVTDSLGSFSVKISRSVNFDQDNEFPAVSGAIVTITDKTANQIYTLSETASGYYQTTGLAIAGIGGHTYELYISTGNKILTATATMPVSIPLDSLYTQISGFRKGSISIVPVYTDPVALGNFYRFVLTKNDTISDAIYVRNDKLVNGQIIKQPLNGGGGGGSKISPGDIVTVEMECIDSMIYQFYYTLGQSRNANSATPTNPVSNIKGGQALGYFGAHTTSTQSLIVPF